ncbi:MAG: hypothetical protein H7Z41_07025 [Cytophagales bacterium]|nr:hypothetical protein [Armatimonadota bacterium]
MKKSLIKAPLHFSSSSPRAKRIHETRAARLAVLSAAFLMGVHPADAAPAETVLTVGGGPDLAHNQVAIESNVAYLSRLLPAGTPNTILFADGRTDTSTVQYSDAGAALSDEEQAFRLAFRQNTDTSVLRYRAPKIKSVAGPARRASIHAQFDTLSTSKAAGSLLLYFTGHGSPSRSDPNNNTYDLWGERGLTVQELSAEIARLPEGRPVTLVMVQCFSGAFGNLLFEGGKPGANLVKRPICGFFATTNDRVAAGCTPEVNEADYKDFTSYFFAALTGRDRLGRAVPPPDYNKDGRVGMDEAFAYALVAEPSVDVPVATSDLLLRQQITLSDDILAGTSAARVRALASPSQKAAFDGISRALGDESEDRLKHALDLVRSQMQPTRRTRTGGDISPGMADAAKALQETRRKLEQQFPGLRENRKTAPFEEARVRALAFLKSRPETVQSLLAAGATLDQRQEERYSRELKGVRSLRLLRVAKSVLLEAQLRAGGNAEKIAQFEQLKQLEADNPLRTS